MADDMEIHGTIEGFFSDMDALDALSKAPRHLYVNGKDLGEILHEELTQDADGRITLRYKLRRPDTDEMIEVKLPPESPTTAS